MIEIVGKKYQVFVIREKSNHTVWQYNSFKEALEQYNLIRKEDKKELQEVFILRIKRRR